MRNRSFSWSLYPFISSNLEKLCERPDRGFERLPRNSLERGSRGCWWDPSGQMSRAFSYFSPDFSALKRDGPAKRMEKGDITRGAAATWPIVNGKILKFCSSSSAEFNEWVGEEGRQRACQNRSDLPGQGVGTFCGHNENQNPRDDQKDLD